MTNLHRMEPTPPESFEDFPQGETPGPPAERAFGMAGKELRHRNLWIFGRRWGSYPKPFNDVVAADHDDDRVQLSIAWQNPFEDEIEGL
jgi:hypothetical protein